MRNLSDMNRLGPNQDYINQFVDMLRKFITNLIIYGLIQAPLNLSAQSCNRVLDSLVLIKLYQATDGSNWITKWPLNQSMNTWYGVNINAQGCVTQINLSNNGLKGVIPEEIGNLGQLNRLFLFTNNISGTIPLTLTNCTELIELNLEGNFISGNIPPLIGRLRKLSMLSLASNALTGSIPEELFTIDNLLRIDLGRNQLTGSIPSNIDRLIKLQFLDLSENKLSGEIPSNIGTLNALKDLYLSYNNFSGQPPATMSLLINMMNLWLNNNAFSGKVPDLTASPLISLRVENNDFNEIPDYSGVTTLGRVDPLGLVMHNNHFTFEDLIPLLDIPRFINWNYKPQKPITLDSIQYVQYGTNYAIRLNVDPGIQDNNYKWFKDTSILNITNQNFFQIIQLSDLDEGYYSGSVVNQKFPDFEIFISPIRIVGFNPARCDKPLAGENCEVAPDFCNTKELHNYCGNLSITEKIRANLCDSINVLDNPRYLRFTANTDSLVLEIFPMSCSDVEDEGITYQGLEAALLTACDTGVQTTLYCTHTCQNKPFYLGGKGFVKGQDYILVIDGCLGNLCNYLIKVRAGNDFFKLIADSAILGDRAFCPDDEDHFFSIRSIDGASAYEWYINDTLVKSSLDTFINILDFQSGIYKISLRAVAKCDTTNLIHSTFRVFPKMTYSNLVIEKFSRDSQYQVKFQILGGTPPFILTQGQGKLDSLTGSFTSTIKLCKSDYYFEIRDKWDCIITISGRENCGCDTYAGTLPTELLTVCEGNNIVAKSNNDFVRDTGDVITYLFCTDSTMPTKSILRQNQSGIFPFDISRYKFDSIYYLVFVIGKNNGSGQVDFSHPCTSFSNAQPVVFRRKPIVSAGPDIAICYGEINLISNGNYSYVKWSQLSGPKSAFISFPDSSETPVFLDSVGTYVFRIEAFNTYCITIDDKKVVYDTVYKPNINGNPLNCGVSEVTLDVGPQLSYLWSTGDTTRTIKVTQSGQYCVTVTNTPGCSGSTCIDVKISAKPDLTIEGNTKICLGKSTTLNSNKDFAMYRWNNGITNKSITVDTSGTYCLTVTNSEGCTASQCVVVTSSPNSSSNRIDSSCNKSNFLFMGKFYSVPGTYNIVLPGANRFGCDSLISLNLVAYSDIAIKDSMITPDIGGGTGSIIVNYQGGNLPYTYQWNTGAKTRNINNLTSGIYTVTVTDAKNCSYVFSFNVKSAVGINALEKQKNFEIYPNPNLENNLFFWRSEELNGNWKISLIDVSGKLVSLLNFRNCEAHKSYRLEVPNPYGIIFIKAEHESGFQSLTKLIILH